MYWRRVYLLVFTTAMQYHVPPCSCNILPKLLRNKSIGSIVLSYYTMLKEQHSHIFSRKGTNIMSTTQPIRNKQKLQNFKNYYRDVKPDIRNYTIIIVGLNTALRISDILNLTYDDIYWDNKVKDHITVREQKTGKENRILLNKEARYALKKYHDVLISTKMYQTGNPYLFPSPRTPKSPLSRSQTYRMIISAAKAVGIQEHISCHSLRKTFGYHAWKQGSDPVVIMIIFNHSSLSITKRYLCIEQDDKDDVYRSIYQKAAA